MVDEKHEIEATEAEVLSDHDQMRAYIATLKELVDVVDKSYNRFHEGVKCEAPRCRSHLMGIVNTCKSARKAIQSIRKPSDTTEAPADPNAEVKEAAPEEPKPEEPTPTPTPTPPPVTEQPTPTPAPAKKRGRKSKR